MFLSPVFPFVFICSLCSVLGLAIQKENSKQDQKENTQHNQKENLHHSNVSKALETKTNGTAEQTNGTSESESV